MSCCLHRIREEKRCRSNGSGPLIVKTEVPVVAVTMAQSRKAGRAESLASGLVRNLDARKPAASRDLSRTFS